MGSHLRFYEAGEVIFHQGETSDCAYVIEHGKVDIFIEDESLDTLVVGDLFGEMGVLDQKPRSTSARALTQVALLKVKTNQITERLQGSDPIVKALVRVLLKRFRSLLSNDTSLDSDVLFSEVESVIEDAGLTKIKLESELRTAIGNQQIETVYQPINDIATGDIAGFEALSRWEHPDKGVISPFEFITLAEETDLIVDVGRLVFERACQVLSRLPEHYFININVSPKQLDNDLFLQHVVNLMKQNGVAPSRLKLEITETMVVDFEQANEWIHKCKALGFPICADDFGTGHSGMQQLVELDFDVLKVDQVFIRNMFENKKYATVLQSIARIGTDLGMKLVAEGVEEKEQYQSLKLLGFDYGQGYYFGRPMSESDVLKLTEK
ncbi:EAL domain-containing protein [Marinicella rhabdoformis]|uniref:EAL domain-containing protein n=1 Tax=Marinicella rhabdoformis TaxID=2580566 RepID=UPI0012AEB7E8|nr:EAL domain-containing protein [Marinicella rhabdoformis]